MWGLHPASGVLVHQSLSHTQGFGVVLLEEVGRGRGRDTEGGREGRREDDALLGVQSLLLKPPALALSPLRGPRWGREAQTPSVSRDDKL